MPPADALKVIEFFPVAGIIGGRGKSMLTENFAPSFELAMARKDVRLMIETAGSRPLATLPGIAARMDALIASGLTSMGLPRAEIPLALLLFNVGVEVGQIAFVALILLLERSFRTLEIRWPRFAEALPGYVVGSLGAYWTLQRTFLLFS